MKKTLAIDFDGTLSEYHGWRGLTDVGPPLDKARKAMILLSRKFRLVCYTLRPPDLIEAWLRRWGFPPMKVTNIKPRAHLYIDDRALQFTGQWTDELLKQIETFTPYWIETDNDSPQDDTEEC